MIGAHRPPSGGRRPRRLSLTRLLTLAVLASTLSSAGVWTVATTPALAGRLASLEVDPTSGPAGTAFEVTGEDHFFCDVVFIMWDDPATELATVDLETLDSSDFGPLSVEVPGGARVPPGGEPVSHTVRSECSSFGEGGPIRVTQATATFTVTPSPAVTTTTTTTTVVPTTTTTVFSPRRVDFGVAVTPVPPLPPLPPTTDVTTPPEATPPPPPGPPQVLGEEVRRERPERNERTRSVFPASLRDPTEVSLDLGLLASNAGLAALIVLLFAFCSELFNKTVEENYDEIQGWLAPLRRGLGQAREALSDIPRFVPLVALTVLVGILSGFLDPDFGFDRVSLALLLGLVIAFLVATLTFELVDGAHARRRGAEGYLRLFPAALVVAFVCVLLSRLVHFKPGYLFGLVAGFTILRGRLSEDDQGRGLGLAALALLGVCLVAWFAWIPLDHAAEGTSPGFWTLVGDAALAGIFVTGLEALVFQLVPLRFLDGAKLKAWSTLAWAALFTLTIFGFLQVLLRPAETGYADTAPRESLATAIVLFVVFALGTVSFWAFFRIRGPRAAPAPAGAYQAPTIDLTSSPASQGGDGDGVPTGVPSEWERAMERVRARS